MCGCVCRLYGYRVCYIINTEIFKIMLLPVKIKEIRISIFLN